MSKNFDLPSRSSACLSRIGFEQAILDIPMRIVSANLNQRIGNAAARACFELWLKMKAPDLPLSQEPFRPSQGNRPAIQGYRLVSTSSLVCCWVAENHLCPRVIEHSERWHEIRIYGGSANNVYLGLGPITRSGNKKEMNMDIPRNPDCPKCGTELDARLEVPEGASVTPANQDRYITFSCKKCGFVGKPRRKPWWKFWR